MSSLPHSHPVIHQYLATNPVDTAAKSVRATIVTLACKVLDAAPDQTLTTNELAKAILVPGPIKHVYSVLLDAAKHELAPYVTQGDPVLSTRGYNTGKLVRPWFWHSKKDRPAPARGLSAADIIEMLTTIEAKLDQLLTRQ